MELTKLEKEYLLELLNKELQVVKSLENTPDEYFATFAAEVKWEQFLNALIEKIKKARTE